LKLTLVSHEVRTLKDLDAVFAALMRQRPSAILTLVDEFMNQPEPTWSKGRSNT
jgi:hypothetical protein